LVFDTSPACGCDGLHHVGFEVAGCSIQTFESREQTMNKLIISAAFALLGGVVSPVHAADTSTAPAPAITARAEVAQGKGMVNKVDVAAGIVNINHEAIAVLKWMAMTMDFKVTDKKLLGAIKPGQTVVFGLVKDPVAGYVISRIEAAK